MNEAAARRVGDEAPLHRRHISLLRSSFSLSTAAAVAAIGGFFFWLLVARVAPAATVGKAAGLFSSIQFVTYATALGLPIAVARYGGSRKHDPSVLFNWSVTLTVASSFLGAALYLAIFPNELRALSTFGVAGSVLLFGLLVAGISIGAVLDVRLISQHRRGWVVARAVAIGLIRLPFIFAGGLTTSATGIFIVAAGAPALCGFASWALADLRDGHRFAFPLRPLPPDARSALHYAMVNGAGQLAVQGPFFALPVIVLLVVSPRANASFYIAWTIATVLFLIVQGIGQALLIEGNRSGRLETQTRAALQFAVALACVLAILCAIGSKVLPFLYGASYTAGANILPILGAAVIPWAVFTVVLAATRVRHDHARNLGLSSLFALSVLAPGAIWVVKFGIDGAGVAWLIGNLVAAAGAAVVLRRILKASSLDASSPGAPTPPVQLLDATALG